MIIKSMTRKGSPSFGQLLGYIDHAASKDQPTILHNLNSNHNLKKIESEFLKNFQCCPKRKNGIVLYHEILSFSVLDKHKLTPEIVEALGREYLNLRAPKALGYAKAHFENDSIHLHVMLSGNLINSKKKLRLSKKQFSEVKQEIEQIQKERYPELCNSLVHQKKEMPEKRKQKRSEREQVRRLKKEGGAKLTENKRAARILHQCLQASGSEQDFNNRLQKAGFLFYIRGKTSGVKDIQTGRKHRLKTLGYLQDYEQAQERWQKLPARTAEIKAMQQNLMMQKLKELNYRKDILEVLEWRSQPDPDEPPHIQKRRKELNRVARLQREMRRNVKARAERSR